MPASPSASPGARPQASPFRLFQAINGFHLTEGIRTAVELDLFTAIGAGHRTAAAIAHDRGVADRGARILCDFMVVHGFLAKAGQEYSLTAPSAMFLDRKSPAYMGTCTRFLINDPLREHFRAQLKEVDEPLVEEPLHVSFRSVPTLLEAIDAVFADPDAAAGVAPVKINEVVGRGYNEEDVADLARLTFEHPWQVRVTEMIPFAGATDLQQ